MAGSVDLKRLAKGLSEVAFRQRYGTGEPCREALFAMRWGRGWRCQGCGHERHAALKQRAVLQCNRCKRQVSLTVGTIFHGTRLPLTIWFLAIHHLAQSKGGIKLCPAKYFKAVPSRCLWRSSIDHDPTSRQAQPSQTELRREPNHPIYPRSSSRPVRGQGIFQFI